MLIAMPDVVGLSSAVVVGVVMVWAGASKLVAGSSWSDSVASEGIPRWILNPLPLLEVIIGALTAVRLWVPVIPLVLAGLLMAFSGWILVAIRKDDVPTCACFGSMSKKPIGWQHVARNSVLIALAASAAFV
ncbi:MAG: hypothetical protein CL410_05135 [Acidimicrobiaceae bacterium]|nr:hypothetical protein [Acidimicrobiaceae bacterium]